MAVRRIPSSLSALVEVVLLFSPAIPAYLWLWPNLASESANFIAQCIVYVYFLAGCLWIGLRRWNWKQLGLNREGLGVSLVTGFILILALTLGRLATDLPLRLSPPTFKNLLVDFLFYLGLVGFVEEFLFRRLIYRALLDWRGTMLAILGSSVAFGLYHIGWAGALGMLGLALIGFVFGMIRWRAGGILGLILMHGFYDIISTQMYPDLTTRGIEQISVIKPGLALL